MARQPRWARARGAGEAGDGRAPPCASALAGKQAETWSRRGPSAQAIETPVAAEFYRRSRKDLEISGRGLPSRARENAAPGELQGPEPARNRPPARRRGVQDFQSLLCSLAMLGELSVRRNAGLGRPQTPRGAVSGHAPVARGPSTRGGGERREQRRPGKRGKRARVGARASEEREARERERVGGWGEGEGGREEAGGEGRGAGARGRPWAARSPTSASARGRRLPGPLGASLGRFLAPTPFPAAISGLSRRAPRPAPSHVTPWPRRASRRGLRRPRLR